MANYCGKCGAKLDETTGLCPKCDADKLNKQTPKSESIETPTPKQDTVLESANPLSKKEAKENRKADKKASKKAKRKEKWAAMTFGQKVGYFFSKVIAFFLSLAILLSMILAIFVYFDIIDVPVISIIMDTMGIKDVPEPDGEFIQIGGKFTSVIVVDSDSAIAAAQEVAKNVGLGSAANELSVANINTVDGVTYYRLQQNYNGIPVYGRTFIVSADVLGNTQSLSSNSIVIDEVDTSMTIPLDEAKAIIENYLNSTFKASEDDGPVVFDNYSEVIYTFSEEQPAYAYRFYATIGDELYDVFLGVAEKRVIACFSANLSQTASGTGTDVNGNNVSFDAEKKSDTSYTLEDFNRNIRVFDADNKKVVIGDDYIYIVDSKGNVYKADGSNWVDENNNIVTVEDYGRKQGNWKVIDKNGNTLDENAYALLDIYGRKTKLNPVTSSTSNFTNSKAVTLMKQAQNIYDFFLAEFGRIGFDNANGSMLLVVNNRVSAYSNNYGPDGPTSILVFGKDDELTTEQIGHEYMHSVEKTISGMQYSGESGAIMEAYSDLFGEILEDYSDGILDGSCDWIHHAKTELGYDHSRNFINPNDSNNPSKVGEETRPFWLRLVIAKDEVHHCSTIISHAAYIMTTNQGDGEPLTVDELMNLWYRTLLTLPTNCTFSNLRESMIITANNIGLTTEKINKVSSAFSMVGVECNNYSGEYATDIQISVFDNEGKSYNDYSIDISGQKKSFLWFTEDYNVSYDGSAEPVSVHLNKGDYTVTITDKNNADNSYSKTISVSQRATGKELRFATDFGKIQYESQQEGTFEPSDIPVAAVGLNGHYYYAYNLDTVTTWEEAKEYCESQGGYLATITNREEDEFVYSYLRNNFDYESAYFGFTDRDEEGTWVWDNGEVSSYTNWHSGEPNDENPNEDYAMYYYKYDDGAWNDGDFGNQTVNGGKAFICEWGEYSVTSVPSSASPTETNSAYEKYLAAAAKTTESGSWSEQLTLEADMSISYDSGKTKTKVTLTADSDVSNYAEDDLSQIEITSLANMKVMGQTYSWRTEYYDGIAHYEYTEPFQRSESLEITPAFFNFEASIPEEAILTEEVSGNQIRFIISGEEMNETGISAVQQMSGVSSLECEDVEVIATLNDSGRIDQIELNFDAFVEYQGYDADVTYKIQYMFS